MRQLATYEVSFNMASSWGSSGCDRFMTRPKDAPLIPAARFEQEKCLRESTCYSRTTTPCRPTRQFQDDAWRPRGATCPWTSGSLVY